MISRTRAEGIAKAEASRLQLGPVVGAVVSFQQIQGRLPLVYGVDLTRCWIAYIKAPGPLALRSSVIVAIDRETGLVVYSGSANDEG